MLSDPLFEVSIPNRERHSIGYLAKDFSSLADSDSDERVSLFFYFLQIWLRKLNLRRRLIHQKKKKVFSPPNPIYKPRAQMSRGKSKVYLRKTQKEVIQEEEELDRGTAVVFSRKRGQSCQKHTKVGGH